MNLPAEQEGHYSNFFKIGYNAFELVIEFGQAYGEEERIHTRIVTTVDYAKALAELLQTTLNEHAENFGPPRARGKEGS